MDRHWLVRAVAAILLLVCLAALAHGFLTAPTTASEGAVPTAEPRDGVTVVTESARAGTLIAWRPNGSVLYYADEHTKYYDVDPVANTSHTVEYVAVDTIHTAGPTCSSPPCTRNVVERANLSTGEVREVYARYDAAEHAAEWHDHVRVDENHVLIADMIHDQVFLVNTTTELVEWRWDGQTDYRVTGGGPYPEDWMHLNDVELLDDGRIVVSLRNQDQVVFLEPESGLQENWTLGRDGAHDVLYEQHNPDYIPAARGGPALLVADSENGRIVEYQRANGSWQRSWQWADERIQWPRDADRLPNGHTLVADTHGDRIVELDRDGDVEWQVPVTHPYDVERLGTGPGSAGGESAQRLGLPPRTNGGSGSDGGGFDPLAIPAAVVHGLVPSWVVNGVLYVAPIWMGRPQFAALAVGGLTILVWLALEVRWRLPPLGLRWPIYRR